MQRVQSFTCCETPSMTNRVFWTFGRQRRFVLRSEWLTLWPETGALPHRSHRIAKLYSPFKPADDSAIIREAS